MTAGQSGVSILFSPPKRSFPSIAEFLGRLRLHNECKQREFCLEGDTADAA